MDKHLRAQTAKVFRGRFKPIRIAAADRELRAQTRSPIGDGLADAAACARNKHDLIAKQPVPQRDGKRCKIFVRMLEFLIHGRAVPAKAARPR